MDAFFKKTKRVLLPIIICGILAQGVFGFTKISFADATSDKRSQLVGQNGLNSTSDIQIKDSNGQTQPLSYYTQLSLHDFTTPTSQTTKLVDLANNDSGVTYTTSAYNAGAAGTGGGYETIFRDSNNNIIGAEVTYKDANGNNVQNEYQASTPIPAGTQQNSALNALQYGTPQYRDPATTNVNNAPASTLNSATQAANALPPIAPICMDFRLTSGIDINWPVCAANISNAVLYITAWVLWVAGQLFDYALSWSMDIKTLVNQFPIVTLGWQILRDLANLCFMFILLYIAIMTILRATSFDTKRILITVIISAVLLNFSFLFAAFIIDTSNIVAVTIFNDINPNTATTNNVAANDSRLAHGISGIFLQGLGLTTIYNTVGANGAGNTSASSQQITGAAPGSWNIVIVGIGGSILMLVTSFVLLAASVLFLIRIIVLVLLLMSSALAVAAYALPQTKKFFDQWLGLLINQAIFAPAFLLMMYIVTKIISASAPAGASAAGTASLTTNLGNANFASLLAGQGSSINSLFTFVMLIGFMIASLIVASRFGAYGSKTAIDTGKSLVNSARGGVQGAIGRNTAGRLAQAAGKGYDSNVAAPTARFFRDNAAGKFIAKYGNRATLGIAGATTKSIDQSIRGGLTTAEKAKYGGAKNLEESQKQDKERMDTLKANTDKQIRKQEREVGIAAYEDHKSKQGTPGYASSADEAKNLAAINTLQTMIAQMSDKEISEEKIDTLMKDAVLESLTDRQLEGIMKNDKIGDADKKKLIDKKFGPIKKFLDDAVDTSKPVADRDEARKKADDAIKKLSDKQLELAGPGLFFPEDQTKKEQGELAMGMLKQPQADFITDINKAQGFGKVQKASIGEFRDRPFKEALETTAFGPGLRFTDERSAINEVRKSLEGRKGIDVAKLPGDRLKNPRVIRSLDKAILYSMRSETSPETRNKIAEELTKLDSRKPGFTAPAESLTTQEEARIQAAVDWINSPKGDSFVV